MLLYYFCSMESNRQKKIAGVLQLDLVDVLQGAVREGGMHGVLISVSKVSVTTDLSVAKVYLSIFPEDRAKEMLKGIQSNQPLIKHELAKRTRNQLRRMPQLLFFIDDTLAYLDGIDRSLKGENNPIKDPSLLEKRKKA